VRQSAGRCSLGTIATKLDLSVTLPRWKAPAGTPEDELELWKHYVEALRLAEGPRLEQARAFERTLPPQLYALPAAESCTAFEAAMKTRFEALRAETQSRFTDHR
jgi:predicted secreted Zn-dependent protease